MTLPFYIEDFIWMVTTPMLIIYIWIGHSKYSKYVSDFYVYTSRTKVEGLNKVLNIHSKFDEHRIRRFNTQFYYLLLALFTFGTALSFLVFVGLLENPNSYIPVIGTEEYELKFNEHSIWAEKKK